MDLAVLDPIGLSLTFGLITVLLLVLVLYLWYQQVQLTRKYKALLQGPMTQNLGELILSHAAHLEDIDSRMVHLAGAVERQGRDALRHIQRVGMVRFNAFADTGSDLSFAIALLDANHNGVVLSSLYARHESRTYAKPIMAGKSSYALSDEEREAIAKAIASPM